MIKKCLKFLFSRMMLVIVLLAVQFAFMMYSIWWSGKYSVYAYWTLTIISAAVVLYILNRRDNPAYKLVWIILILIFPLFGGMCYILFGCQGSTRFFRQKLDVILKSTQPLLRQDRDVFLNLAKKSLRTANQAKYIAQCGFPVYENTACTFLSSGEAKFSALLCELNKAERFIFLEYFIIGGGQMWEAVKAILAQKAKSGVTVRIMYDAMGSLVTIPAGFQKEMESLGIACVEFNPFRPVLSAVQNNRDHRKIVVIDGRTAFTGGINIADEYINKVKKHGHWKDASIMVKGEAVWSFTVMFLQLWSLYRPEDSDFTKFRPQGAVFPPADGFTQPYADSPLDGENVGELVYLNLINKAQKYVYITTPYLIIDHDMITALTLAAKSGVDVRIITPHIGDKWFVHMTTRSYYEELVLGGVKIYEYTPGFIHSKTFVSDDSTATVGSVNLDYRSLYLHFECGVWLFESKAASQVKADFLKTLAKSEQITLETISKNNFFVRLAQKVLQVFAPLM